MCSAPHADGDHFILGPLADSYQNEVLDITNDEDFYTELGDDEESSRAFALEDSPVSSFIVARSTCNLNHFACVNGQCIDVMLMCDGRDDCFDGSDESECDQFMSVFKR